MQRFVPLTSSLAENDEESALLAMLLDDFYQETFYAPVVPTVTEEVRSAHAVTSTGRKRSRRSHGYGRR
jgi:ATP-dependent RNA helicase DeaD